MARFEDYANQYQTVRMERRDGILQITFHTQDGSLKWGEPPHRELGHTFADIGSDPDNKMVIMTATGEAFCAERDGPRPGRRTPRDWDKIYWEGKKLLMNLLDIEAPIIGAINGPAGRVP